MRKNIPRQLQKKPFSVKEATSYGLSKAYLTRMIKAGVLTRLTRGVYQVVTSEEDTGENQYRAATLRCGMPSAITLLSALEYYHLTDLIPKKTWVLVPHEKRVLSNQMKLVRSRDPKWNIGIRKEKGYWITSLERTLIDGLIYKRIIGSQTALDAIKQAIVQKKVKLGNLYDMAKKMGVEHRIRPYIEALAS